MACTQDLKVSACSRRLAHEASRSASDSKSCTNRIRDSGAPIEPSSTRERLARKPCCFSFWPNSWMVLSASSRLPNCTSSDQVATNIASSFCEREASLRGHRGSQRGNLRGFDPVVRQLVGAAEGVAQQARDGQ